MSDSNALGRELERSVLAVETLLLESEPSLQGRAYEMNSRVIKEVAGVRHEIDILVRLEGPLGYDATFIFECKNWKQPVGKNEIIVLVEKIAVFQAQRAFIVAPRLTRDAKARAAADPRIVVVEAARIQPAAMGAFANFHYLIHKKPRVEIYLGAVDPSAVPSAFDPSRPLLFRGQRISVRALLGGIVEKLASEAMEAFPSGELPTGDYEATIEHAVEFAEHELVCDGLAVAAIRLQVAVPVAVVRPSATSCFDLVGRGKTITFSGVDKYGTHVDALVIAARSPRRPE